VPMKLKQLLILISILISGSSFSQEFILGVNVGYIPNLQPHLISYGGSVEFRHEESVMSYNFDPFLINVNDKFIFTAPVYLKYIIGKRLRFCPLAGGFVRTNANVGLLYGLSTEYKISEKFRLLLKGERYLDFYSNDVHDHFGGTFKSRGSDSSFLFSFGIKKKIY
jgi:hypothetical protein